MDPGLNPEQTAVVKRVAELRPEFARRAPRYDAESSFPIENYADLRKAGLLRMTVPREYGGLGMDWVTYALSMLEMAKGLGQLAKGGWRPPRTISRPKRKQSRRPPRPEQKRRGISRLPRKSSLAPGLLSSHSTSARGPI